MRLISVILNTHSAQARADHTRSLLGWGFSSFEKATPIQPGTSVATAKVGFGKADTVAAGLGVAGGRGICRSCVFLTMVDYGQFDEVIHRKSAKRKT